ncbi:MAG: sensor histidine kinase [Candidatus Hodarchaeales archaeon]|jgi:signal transduction histidine kinase
MNNDLNQIEQLKKENKSLKNKISDLKRNSVAFTQIQYLFHELKNKIELEPFLDIILGDIRKLTGGNPALLLKNRGLWEKYQLKSEHSIWIPISEKESNIYEFIFKKEEALIYPSQINVETRDEENNISTDFILKTFSVNNLSIFKIAENPPSLIEIRDITISDQIPRYITELKDFFLPLNFSIQQAILYDNVNRSSREFSLLLDLLFHDIRNFIANIGIALETIQEMTEEDFNLIQHFTGIANKQTIGAQNLINRVEKILTSEKSKTLKNIDLNEILNESIETIISQYKSDDITIDIIIKDQVFPKIVLIQADDLISEIFFNLFSNSIKYSEGKHKNIEVGWQPWKKNPEFLNIKITDWGIGIPDHKKIQIFSRFQTVKQDIGLGLGLNVVLRLIERYGGYIWFENRIENDVKQGTIANVCLKYLDLS